MDPQAVLQNLAPLREPSAISWWPPAPGWWLLAVLITSGLIALSVVMWRRYRANRYRRVALHMLGDLIARQQTTIEQINRLIKSASLVHWPANQVAHLHGSDWIDFLCHSTRKSLPEGAFEPLKRVYQDPQAQADDALINATRQWIKHHRRQHA
jgi:hypothetical protein